MAHIYFYPTFASEKEKQKGTDAVPFLFMATETQIKYIEDVVNALLKNDPEYFLVNIKVKPTNNIKVYIDGDKGITIEKCISINRALYKNLIEHQVFPNDDFSLEISSPGVGEPLILNRQYIKNKGRTVHVETADNQQFEGLLKEVDVESLLIETEHGKGKKIEKKEHKILLNNIKKTTVQIKF